MNIEEAARYGGYIHHLHRPEGGHPVLRREAMRDGAILANAGHFDVEIDTKALLEKARSVEEVRPNVDEVVLPAARGSTCSPRGG